MMGLLYIVILLNQKEENVRSHAISGLLFPWQYFKLT